MLNEYISKIIHKYHFSSIRLRKKQFSIISNCCIAGMVYSKFGLQFQSPTINLNIPYDDFLKFAANIEQYRSVEIVEEKGYENEFLELGGVLPICFPCGKCKDIKILFQHYDTFEHAREKWKERFTRVNFDRVVVVFLCWNKLSEEQFNSFLSIPYPKVMITTRPGLVNYKNQICMNLGENELWFDGKNDKRGYFWCNYETLDWVRIINEHVG